MAMKNTPHPGQSIRYDCLDPLGLTVSEAAYDMMKAVRRAGEIRVERVETNAVERTVSQ